MRLQLHVLDTLAEHDDPAGIALLTGGGEIKQEPAPYPEPALVIALEPEPPKEYGVVQEHDIHALAVAVGGLKHEILDGFGAPPVPDSESGHKQPEQGSKSHGFSDLPRFTVLIARLPYRIGSGNRCVFSGYFRSFEGAGFYVGTGR